MRARTSSFLARSTPHPNYDRRAQSARRMIITVSTSRRDLERGRTGARPVMGCRGDGRQTNLSGDEVGMVGGPRAALASAPRLGDPKRREGYGPGVAFVGSVDKHFVGQCLVGPVESTSRRSSFGWSRDTPYSELGLSPEVETMRASTRLTNALLWAAQSVLAALFLFAGGMKLVLPAIALKAPVALPILFLRFIGIAEVLGGLGLVIPGLLKLSRGLTAVAATGLVTIMAGATTVTIEGGAIRSALVPLAVGAIAMIVAWARWSWLGRRVWGPRQKATRSVTGRLAWTPDGAGR
jgi:hypothetical protein